MKKTFNEWLNQITNDVMTNKVIITTPPTGQNYIYELYNKHTTYEVKVYDYKTIWYKDGLIHREEGPAIEWSNGDKEWYQHGVPYRKNGPTVERANGNLYWHDKNGELHREDGPAIKIKNQKTGKFTYRYYIHGVEFTRGQFKMVINSRYGFTRYGLN